MEIKAVDISEIVGEGRTETEQALLEEYRKFCRVNGPFTDVDGVDVYKVYAIALNVKYDERAQAAAESADVTIEFSALGNSGVFFDFCFQKDEVAIVEGIEFPDDNVGSNKDDEIPVRVFIKNVRFTFSADGYPLFEGVLTREDVEHKFKVVAMRIYPFNTVIKDCDLEKDDASSDKE